MSAFHMFSEEECKVGTSTRNFGSCPYKNDFSKYVECHTHRLLKYILSTYYLYSN